MSGWKRGWELDIDADCCATDSGIGACEQYISSEEEFAVYTNRTVLLSAGEKCTIKVVAA